MRRRFFLQLGTGRVGTALRDLVAARRGHLQEALGLDLRPLGWARSRRVCWAPEEVGSQELPLAELPWQACAQAPRDFLDQVMTELQRRGGAPEELVLVDVTAADLGALWLEALERGLGVVSANKIPLAGSQERFDALWDAARRSGGRLGVECTVGAALPVVRTLRQMLATGDRVEGVTGCLSGTLGVVCGGLGQGRPLSEVVAAAHREGFTEPDPREDLRGSDVARKALILSRLLGWPRELAEVEVESLVPGHLEDSSPAEFLDRLGDLDRVPVPATTETESLAYLARVEPGRVSVGLQRVPASGGMGSLQGADNRIEISSRRYAESPLVIQGAGAGTERTASGVLAEMIGDVS